MAEALARTLAIAEHVPDPGADVGAEEGADVAVPDVEGADEGADVGADEGLPHDAHVVEMRVKLALAKLSLLGNRRVNPTAAGNETPTERRGPPFETWRVVALAIH